MIADAYTTSLAIEKQHSDVLAKHLAIRERVMLSWTMRQEAQTEGLLHLAGIACLHSLHLPHQER